MSALFQGGFTQEELGSDDVDKVSEIVEHSLKRGGGLLGFGKHTCLWTKTRLLMLVIGVPEVVPDVDDASKAITILRFLGKPALAELMMEEFYTVDHFRIYHFEKDSSFTVNCNVLACLLATDLYSEESNS